MRVKLGSHRLHTNHRAVSCLLHRLLIDPAVVSGSHSQNSSSSRPLSHPSWRDTPARRRRRGPCPKLVASYRSLSLSAASTHAPQQHSDPHVHDMYTFDLLPHASTRLTTACARFGRRSRHTPTARIFILKSHVACRRYPILRRLRWR